MSPKSEVYFVQMKSAAWKKITVSHHSIRLSSSGNLCCFKLPSVQQSTPEIGIIAQLFAIETAFPR